MSVARFVQFKQSNGFLVAINIEQICSITPSAKEGITFIKTIAPDGTYTIQEPYADVLRTIGG
jgi:hypothetical protein